MAIYNIEEIHADDPESNTEEWVTEIPERYKFLAPILEARDFIKLMFVVDCTQVTIKSMEQ